MRAGSRRSRGARRNRWSTAMTSRRGRKTGVTNSKSSAVATTSAARRAWVVALGLAAGCALKGDVRKVELQVQALQADLARSDAARAAERDTILAAVRLLQQALATQQAYLVQMRGDLRTELLSVQQQLVSVQELTGQSQQRLTELRSRIEARNQQQDNAGPSGARAPAARRSVRPAILRAPVPIRCTTSRCNSIAVAASPRRVSASANSYGSSPRTNGLPTLCITSERASSKEPPIPPLRCTIKL